MKIASLSAEQAPPISVPLRFFAVAPAFLALAALLLAMADGNPIAELRSPAQIAATHHITLGFMAMVMMGAVQQLLPVVIGSPMPASRWVAWLTFLPLIAGVLFLSAGFMLGKPVLLDLSWPLLGLAFLVFIAASLTSVARATAKNATKTALLLAILSLAGAVVLGMLLARGYANGLALPYAKLSAAHISLALGGWVLLLAIGVSYQVVPMFQLTPNYPKWMTVWLAPAIFATLLLNLALLLPESTPRWAGFAAETIFWVLACSFAVVTLRLQSQRRRHIPDAPLSFFRMGMASLMAAALFSLAALAFPSAAEQLRTLSALAFLLGFALSLIQGMLYKIVPFLVWFHLFRGGLKTGVPNMKAIIPESGMWHHLRLHGATLFAALLAPWWNAAGWLVMLGLLLQGALLGYGVYTGIAVYRRTLLKIEQTSP
ncbi:hypothetical protein [Candidatus Ferrigenium straubiae]|jgi:hypothetical protein|uniref:hypothetical protein n=1 Tax=Candidatus Ferrigenium straubiae TaxID=2919506 RepID=UPI003F4A8AE0